MAVVGSGQCSSRIPAGGELRQERGHHRWKLIETSWAESSHECFRRQPIKITKISTPVQDHGQTSGLEMHQEADTACSHVEQGYGRLVIGRERGRRRILYRHEMLPQELRFLR